MMVNHKRWFFQGIFLFLTFSAYAQIDLGKGLITKIVYNTSYNDRTDPDQNQIWLLSNGNKALITNRDQMNGKASYLFEMIWANTERNNYVQYAFLENSACVSMMDSTSIGKQDWSLLDETKEILGHRCKKARTSINSNTIEIFYTDELKVKGGPSLLGVSLGLVLELVRNGNYKVNAPLITKEEVSFPDFVKNVSPLCLEKIDYNDRIWRSRFVTVPVFDHQQICFTDGPFEIVNGNMRFANGTIVVKKVKFPQIGKHDQVFLDLTQRSNGDAYDRTGSVFLIPTDKEISFLNALQDGISILPVYENGNGKKYQGVAATPQYSPLLELMRFFTPFGIGHFGDRVILKGKTWLDSLTYRQEISDYAGLLSGKEVYIGAFIGNYDKGGHIISMNFTIHKDQDLEMPEYKVIPLFNSTNVMEMAGQEYGTMFDSENGLRVEFELKESLKACKLKYITTGHGGWERGDEFVRKKNTVSLDDKPVFELVPWREDCGTYRLYNPVSGNFPNGLSSSDYSRSNWCPGTVTNPLIIDLGDLPAGKHVITVRIPQGKPEGSSFSAWNVSGVLIGE